jgi:hypothetical protein
VNATIILAGLGVVAATVALLLRLYDARYSRTARGRIVGWGRVRTHIAFIAMYVAFIAEHSTFGLACVLAATLNDLAIRWQVRRETNGEADG